MKLRYLLTRSYNPHRVGGECCRDYQIGNITLTDVPDSFILGVNKFRGPYGFAIGNVIVSKSKITVTEWDIGGIIYVDKRRKNNTTNNALVLLVNYVRRIWIYLVLVCYKGDIMSKIKKWILKYYSDK